MNKEEFIGKLQMVYVGDRNAFNEIVDVYDELKGDNKHLNDLLNGALKEYDRLNNIIDELEKYINETKLKEFEKVYGKRYSKTFTQAEVIVCNMILNKLKELKEGNKE